MSLLDNELFLKLFLPIVSPILGALIASMLKILPKLFVLIFRKNYRHKRKELCEKSTYYRLFYKYFKKRRVKFRYYPFSISETNKLKSKTNYIIIGDGGVGKSSYLINDFNKTSPITYNKIFYSSEDIINFNPEDAENNIKNNRKTIIYLDGLDELSGIDENQTKENISKIAKIISIYKKKSSAFFIKISCRENFYKRYIMEILNHYTINALTIKLERQKCDFMSFLLKNLKKDLKSQYKKELQQIKINKEHFNSDLPIFNIFYVYKKLILNIDDEKITDLYNYYDSFINAYYLTTPSYSPSSPRDIDEMAEVVFEHYRNGGRILVQDLHKFNNLSDFVYKDTNGSATFIHHSFFEYFLAKYIINLLKNANSLDYNRLFNYFNKESNNDLNDIIRDGINNIELSQRQKICANLFKCYEVTLSDVLKRKLKKNYNNIQKIIHKYADTAIADFDKSQIANYHELIAKKEICLRFSRITGLQHNFLKAQLDFLKFIYYNDEATINKIDRNDIENVKDYFKAILQRWSAIGASWLANEIGGDEIEINYIEKMLANPGDKNPYDFANRSNTLLYYGDVKYGDIFTFVDINKNIDWNIAGEKRLGRLKHLVNLNILTTTPTTSNEITAIKDYRFRAFDLATIYTFLLSRLNTVHDFAEKYKKYYDVIKDLQLQYVVPIKASKERQQLILRRNKLMIKIQKCIINLFENHV